jgi:hypothetical protein
MADQTAAPAAAPALKPGDIVFYNVKNGVHKGQKRPAIVLRTFPASGEPPKNEDGNVIDTASEAGRDWLKTEEGEAWNKSPAGQAYKKAHPGVHLYVFGVEPAFTEVHLATPNSYTREP